MRVKTKEELEALEKETGDLKRKKIEIDPKNPKYLQTLRGAGYVLWIE